MADLAKRVVCSPAKRICFVRNLSQDGSAAIERLGEPRRAATRPRSVPPTDAPKQRPDLIQYDRKRSAWGDRREKIFNAPGPTRTGTPGTGTGPQPAVYTNSTTGAVQKELYSIRGLCQTSGMVDAKRLALFVNSFELSYTGTRFPASEITGSPDSPSASACQGDKACVFALSPTPAPRCPTST